MVRAKHIHKYLYAPLSKFTKGWSCALDGCTHHLPRNVEERIVGSMTICWSCDQVFKLDEKEVNRIMKLKGEEQPVCFTCLMGEEGMSELEYIEQQERIGKVLNKHGIKSLKELTDIQKRSYLNLHELKESDFGPGEGLNSVRLTGKEFKELLKEVEKDVIEVIEADEEHAADCEVYIGGECTCRV